LLTSLHLSIASKFALILLPLFVCFRIHRYGFNPASALVIANERSGEVAALAAVTTTLAAASGCVVAMFADSIIDSMQTGETTYDLTMAMNGCLSGLVAITAGCATVTPWAAILIGAVGGLVYIFGSKTLIRLKIDDAVDAGMCRFCHFEFFFSICSPDCTFSVNSPQFRCI
jgi:ammonia channel protein AmtB